jgi:succinoglycan biosynthesis transport protein ExoP
MSQLPLNPAPPPEEHLPAEPYLDGREPTLRDYAMVLLKRRWTIAAVFVLVVTAAVAYTFTATPLFEARARLLIDSDRPNVIQFEEVVGAGDTGDDYYQTQYNLLESRSLARKTLTNLALWQHPQFAAAAAPGGWGPRALYARARAALSAAPPRAADESEAESLVIDRYLDQLVVSPLRTSRLTDVRFISSDPALAARVVNEHVNAFIDQNLEHRLLATKEASDWLVTQLQEQRRQVAAAEAALQTYRERNGAISLEDGENIVVQKLADLNAAVTRAKTERIEKEARHQQLTAMRERNAALDTFPAVLGNPFIQQQKTEIAALLRQQAELGRRFGDLHPEMVKLRTAIADAQQKLDAEIAKIVESVRNEFLAAQAQEQALTAALNQQKQEALAMNRQAIQYGVLQREVESGRQVYDALLQRAKETGLSTELKTSNIRVVDAAEVPRAPVSPRPLVNLLGAILTGLGFGVFFAYVFEYVDNRIKTPDAVSLYLGLPALAILPLVRESKTPLVNATASAGFIESMRCLRTNLLFARAQGEGPRVVVVTSTGPQEGKSVTASNLAISLAETQLRVLLVDADMRRPRVHEIMGARLDPGLSNLLVGDIKPSQALQRTTLRGLQLVSAGRLPPNPAELLGSDEFRRFLASLDGFFDWVVIDSPPVLPVTDAAILAQLASSVLFVVDAQTTNRYRARHALARLRRVGAPLVGVVLNGADFTRQSAYYSDYYSSDYHRYYVGTNPAEPAVEVEATAAR